MLIPKNYKLNSLHMSAHDKLQASAYQWAHNRFPQIQGLLFAARSEVPKQKDETEKEYLARLVHLKAIGHRKGILDLHLDLPEHKGKAGKPYEFDAKVGADYLKPAQLERIELMRKCGGDGWEFRTLDQFQAIFTKIMRDQFGEDLIIVEAKPNIETRVDQLNADRRAWIKQMRSQI